MSNLNADKPAYPIAGSYDDEHPQVIVPVEHGLTKRELIAAMLLQGLMSNGEVLKTGVPNEKYIESAINGADALLNGLKKDTNE